MALTQFQLKSLRYDLQELASIEYDEVLAELLDHYASLTEQKMTTGLSFDEASKWAWSELGSGPGLKRIQTDYERSLRSQLKTRHFAILKSYFRWPTAFVTLLGGVLIYQLTTMMTPQTAQFVFAIITFTPCFALLYVYINWGDQHNNSQKLAWRYVSQYAHIPIAILNLFNFFSEYDASYFTDYKTLMTFFCVLLLLVSASLFQLAREQFRHKPA